ncbi:MAG: hypothetical protein PHP53_15340 [Prolixibacteraceae bacterium]|nr:hypothetical protein [Prolixibacteraceae bacterium]
MDKIAIKSILEIDFQYFLINFDNDNFLKTSRKNLVEEVHEFIEKEEIEDNAEKQSICQRKLEQKFFHNPKYHRQGEQINFEERKNKIGHLVTKERLKDELFKIINEDIYSISFLTNLSELNNLIDIPDPDLEELKKKFGSLRIRFHQMWCFGNENCIHTILDGINLKELPRLLAFEDMFLKKEMVFFEIEKPNSIEAFIPTIFDAGLSSKWKPGGKTNPENGDEGLEEMVIEKMELNLIVSLLTISN